MALFLTFSILAMVLGIRGTHLTQTKKPPADAFLLRIAPSVIFATATWGLLIAGFLPVTAQNIIIASSLTLIAAADYTLNAPLPDSSFIIGMGIYFVAYSLLTIGFNLDLFTPQPSLNTRVSTLGGVFAALISYGIYLSLDRLSRESPIIKYAVIAYLILQTLFLGLTLHHFGYETISQFGVLVIFAVITLYVSDVFIAIRKFSNLIKDARITEWLASILFYIGLTFTFAAIVL